MSPLIQAPISGVCCVMRFRAHAERYGDPGIDPILVENWVADYPDQTAKQKTSEFAAGHDATPHKWWPLSED